MVNPATTTIPKKKTYTTAFEEIYSGGGASRIDMQGMIRDSSNGAPQYNASNEMMIHANLAMHHPLTVKNGVVGSSI